MKRILYGRKFAGNEISEYGQKNHRVDYGTLAQAFDCINAGSLMDIYPDTDDEWIVENGLRYYYMDSEENEYTYDEAQSLLPLLSADLDELNEKEELSEEEKELKERIENDIEALQEIKYKEYYDYFIISGMGADILKYWTNEYVIYNPKLDLYVWGIDHFGTMWNYVLTEIEFTDEEENV